jgi:hypothetical protein
MGGIREHLESINSIRLERTMKNQKSCEVELTFDIFSNKLPYLMAGHEYSSSGSSEREPNLFSAQAP